MMWSVKNIIVCSDENNEWEGWDKENILNFQLDSLDKRQLLYVEGRCSFVVLWTLKLI